MPEVHVQNLDLWNVPKWSLIGHKNRAMIVLTSTFLVSHLAASTSNMRQKLVNKFGERGLVDVRANVSMFLYGSSLMLYILYTRNDRNLNQYLSIPIMSQYANTLSKIGLCLKVLGFGCLPLFVGQSQPNAIHKGDMQSVEQRTKNAQNMDSIKGMIRITRHPLLLSMSCIFIGDFLICQHWSSSFFCAPMTFVCLVGLHHQDRRHKQWFGKDSVWFQKTSVVPGYAMITEKYSVKQVIEEIGLKRIAMAAAMAYFVHWYSTK